MNRRVCLCLAAGGEGGDRVGVGMRVWPPGPRLIFGWRPSAGFRAIVQATNLGSFASGQKKEKKGITRFDSFPFHRPALVLVDCYDNQWVILWLCQTMDDSVVASGDSVVVSFVFET